MIFSPSLRSTTWTCLALSPSQTCWYEPSAIRMMTDDHLSFASSFHHAGALASGHFHEDLSETAARLLELDGSLDFLQYTSKC